jgi:glucokinase
MAGEARFHSDRRIVMTLDAGGTNLKFSAIRGNTLLFGPVSVPSEAHDLERCLDNIASGFERVEEALPEAPVAISFAFPGPSHYLSGIIGDLINMPAFRGGVPLGPILEERFHIPVFINNDGDLFVYGEAIAGFLPWVNHLLAQAGSPKRYHNLFGITLGTGLGGGIVRNGELYLGDNSSGGEAWLLRNCLDPCLNAEEGASSRAVRRVYARHAGIPIEQAPEPEAIYRIGTGAQEGDREAAVLAFESLGKVAGDVLVQALTLLDGLAVIGGGISAAYPLFLPALIAHMNGTCENGGNPTRRLIATAYDLEDAAQRSAFLKGETREVAVPGSRRKVLYDPLARTAVGISRLGTSEAVAVGAYAFALSKLS